jgi:hypothetical protein
VISLTLLTATWETKNITATNTRQYERGMPYFSFVKSETKPVHTDIRAYKDRKKKQYLPMEARPEKFMTLMAETWAACHPDATTSS